MQNIYELHCASPCFITHPKGESKIGTMAVNLGGDFNNRVPYIASSDPTKGSVNGIGIFWDDSHGIYIWRSDIPALIAHLQEAYNKLTAER